MVNEKSVRSKPKKMKTQMRFKRSSSSSSTQKRKRGFAALPNPGKPGYMMPRDPSLPACTSLSTFVMSDENIHRFDRLVYKRNDCFINAIQLFGALDTVNANILRISSAGDTGFTEEQIERIFILKLGNNFQFQPTDNYEAFTDKIKRELAPNHAIFAGYMDDCGNRHVFILARSKDGTILYIDPQVPPICDVTQCEAIFRDRKVQWWLLFNSPEKMTPDQLRKVGFIL